MFSIIYPCYVTCHKHILQGLIKFGYKRLAIGDVNRPFYSCVLSYLAMNASEAGVDLALIQTSLLFSCKCKLVSIRTTASHVG